MKKKFLKLAEKEGFILFLFLCVCAVAGGTLFLSMRSLDISEKDAKDKDLVILEEQDLEESSLYDMKSPEDILSSLEVVEDTVVEDDELEEVVLATAEDGIKEEEEMEEELEFIEEEEEIDVETVKVVKELPNMILPIEGGVITEYTKDSLIYSKTLESWVGHKAIDIGAKEGQTVVAAMDGVVKEVYDDQLWGMVIVLDHGDEILTRYSNLATKDMVKVGIDVKQGDHISKVGKSAKIEMLMEPHLHFEMINNGKIVDPRSINN